MDERPPVSAPKLLNQFNDWVEGTEMPGRTMAYLKTGMLHEVLAEVAVAADSDAVQSMIDAWNQWEKGNVGPQPTLELLRDNGITDVLGAISS